ncbi:MAG TPA: hypothetical protein VH083_16805 [Myxococcales bacterium]|nr:hypothetical protein [Myxococcales bacterium]
MGCASNRAAPAGKAKPTLASNAGGPTAKGKYTCTFEEDVGSHFRQKVCRYVDDQTDARAQQQDDIREMGMHGTRNPSLDPSARATPSR